MANPTPEKPFGDPVAVLKPNIPDCWSAQPTSGGGDIPSSMDVNVVNSPSVQISGTPTVTVGNTTSNPVPTQEVTSGT